LPTNRSTCMYDRKCAVSQHSHRPGDSLATYYDI